MLRLAHGAAFWLLDLVSTQFPILRELRAAEKRLNNKEEVPQKNSPDCKFAFRRHRLKCQSAEFNKLEYGTNLDQQEDWCSRTQILALERILGS